MIIFLYGPDTYRSRQKLNEIIKRYQAKHKTGLNLRRLDMEEADFKILKEIIETKPMFQEKKLIILENVFEKNQESQKELLDYLAKSDLKKSQEIILVFYKKNLPKEGDLLKFLSKKPVLWQEFEILQGVKLENWIKKEVDKRGGKIEPEAIKKLALEIGGDLWQTNNEINKLLNYKNNQLIKTSDLEILVKPKIDPNIFATIDALASSNKKTALKLLHQHLEKKENEIYLLTMFIYQFRNLIEIKDLVEKGTPYYQIIKKTGLHPFVVKKSFGQIKNFSFKQLKKIYSQLLDLDLAIKTGRIEPRTALDILIMEI